ncbi:MAG: YhjD/YihY/BrkB family envelope integrity protein [Candidatus Brocadiia bacterium]
MSELIRKIREKLDDIRWKEATSPSWWVNFLRYQIRLYIYIIRETVRDRCLRQAAALTFTTLLSLVPLFAIAFSLFRGFATFEGLEKRAERAIFQTLLAAPLQGTEDERTDWQTDPEEMPDLPESDKTGKDLVQKADELPRLGRAHYATRLYLEALRRDASAAAVRDGMATLYFTTGPALINRLSKLPEDLRTEYAAAADVPSVETEGGSWTGYRHYNRALTQLNSLNYDDALEALRKAEKHGYSLTNTRLTAARIHRARAQHHMTEDEIDKAIRDYAEALKRSTDGMVLDASDRPREMRRRLINDHNATLRQLGEVYLRRGREFLEEDSGSVPDHAIADLEKATRYLENSSEAHAALAEALWAHGDVESARRHYQQAARGDKTGAARGFSIAVSSYLRKLIGRASSAGLGILGVLFLLVTATSLFSTIEKTLNGIWQVSEKRPLWIKFTAFCTLLWLGPAMIAAGIFLREKLSQQAATTFLGVPGLEFLYRFSTVVGRYLVPLITVWLVLLAVYKFIPHTSVHFRAASWGAFVGAVLIQIARPAFGIYVSHAVQYERIYGSLSVVPFFLLWLWLLWILVLFGGEVAFTVQNMGVLRFRDRMRRISGHFIDRFLATRIIMYVAREFWRNGRPMTVGRLSDILRIPPEEAADATSRLTKLGYLTPVGEDQQQFHPSSDLSRLKLHDILSATDHFRSETRSRRQEDQAWENTLEDLFSQAIDAQKRALDDTTFRDLMVECEQAEEAQ